MSHACHEITPDLPCNLCGAAAATVLSERSRSGAYLRTVACTGCGLVWSDPRPHDPRRFYTDAYRLEYKGTYAPRPKHVLRAGRVALSRLDKIRPFLRPGLRILDVGSGGGEFAYLLASLGHTVRGVEPNRGYATYAAAEYDLDIEVGFIGDIALQPESYDLITIWHVLEHTEDPGAVLRQLREALRPGGVLVVEVPNVEATCQWPASSFHEAHLFNFNAATLGRLGARVGLTTAATTLAADGGNLTMGFRAAPFTAATTPAAAALPGNHARVAGVVSGHRALAHALSLHPYRRFATRMARKTDEWLRTRVRAPARQRLDRLYAPARAPSAARPERRPLWQYVAAAYAAAVVLEGLLLDTLVPQGTWSTVQAMGLYLVLQTAAVGGIVWATERPRTVPQFAWLAAWAVPLFGLPAYC